MKDHKIGIYIFEVVGTWTVAGCAAHQRDPVAQAQGLGNVVRDHDDGQPPALARRVNQQAEVYDVASTSAQFGVPGAAEVR